MKRLLLALLAVSWLFGAINAQALADPSNGLVETAWLESHIKDAKLVVIDIRLPKDETGYLAGHIPGARFVPWDEVRSSRTSGSITLEYALPTKEEIQKLARKLGIQNDSNIVISSDWSSISSMAFATRMAWTLQYYGIDAVVLNGGFTKWTKENRALEKNAPKFKQGSFKVTSTKPETAANAIDVENAVKAGDTILIDARTPEFFRGDKKKDYVFAFGHIPGAISIPGPLVMSPEGILKPAAELEKMFASAGVTRDKKIIVYCDSGHLSTASWFVLAKVLGYQNVRQFDSSLHEWTRDKGRQMVKEISSVK